MPNYQQPPQSISQIIDAPFPPSINVSPDKQWLLMLELPSLPPIEQLAQKEVKLAGIRINPQVNGRTQAFFINNIWLKSLQDGSIKHFKGLPQQAQIKHISWSPNSQYISFTNRSEKGISLWLVDINTLEAKAITLPQLNTSLVSYPYRWQPNSKGLICTLTASNRGDKPVAPLATTGPIVRENKGKKAQARTYQNLLKNPHDKALFQYYCNSDLVNVTIKGEVKPIGSNGLIRHFTISPNGAYILVKTIHPPFSYMFPYQRFPHTVNVWSFKGEKIQELVNKGLVDDIPITIGSVSKGPRNFGWRSDKEATIYWAEAQDNGDAGQKADIRDQLFTLAAPFNLKDKKASVQLPLRYDGVRWLNDHIAIVDQWTWKNRRIITSLFHPAAPEMGLKTIFDRSWEDRYNNPGSFVSQKNEAGKFILLSDKDQHHLYLMGEGASQEGNRPFLRQINIQTFEQKELWRSTPPYYEKPVKFIDIEKGKLLLSRETPHEPSNYYLQSLVASNESISLSDNAHPYPQMKEVQKEMIHYYREDGVELSATLYLPPQYKKGIDPPLPLVIWAYPREFKNAKVAGQVKESPYQFNRISFSSPLPLLAEGYAILHNPSMPIIGEGDTEPNDDYIRQLVANAKAAIDKVVDMGLANRHRVAIGGHSYGAFMTANLLAHSDLFAAGIARSGAYNRTLTPFGFQSEERNLWQATDTYLNMSPFLYVPQIKTPLLLIHGAEDSNSGTYPMQSERFYNALKGHGAQVRLVMFPHESHGYLAKESIMHMHWEMLQWLDTHVKNKELRITEDVLKN